MDILNSEEWTVRERWFNGSMDLRFSDASFEYSDTPLLDCALALRYAVNILAADSAASVDLNGGPQIQLTLDGARVTVRAAHNEIVAECNFVDLVRAASVFFRDLVNEITRIRPEFIVNQTVEAAYREAGVRQLGREQFLRHSHAIRLRHKLKSVN
ncbi:hypothetical protein ACIRO3_36805 [Streptomyces sp. NPDC102278]|uniref:hypothetical protein n=1 Tax=Streptomyces sp. NPDC102278 TaxID=3366152 RepID=UPI0037F1E0F4